MNAHQLYDKNQLQRREASRFTQILYFVTSPLCGKSNPVAPVAHRADAGATGMSTIGS
jgi:hypothetical protein